MTTLELLLRLPGRVSTGEPVRMMLILRNAGPGPVEILVPGRPPAFDLVVTDSEGAIVWHRLADAPIAMALGVVRLDADACLELDDVWDQRDVGGLAVPAGEYGVRGLLRTEDREYRTPVQVLSIGES